MEKVSCLKFKLKMCCFMYSGNYSFIIHIELRLLLLGILELYCCELLIVSR